MVVDALAAALRAGPADHHHGRRGRPRAGDRLQQVGPGRRGAPLLPRARDRARPRAGAVGAAGQHHRPHRLARRQAGAGARRCAGRLGDARLHRRSSTRSSAGWSPSTRTRCAAASRPRSCSAPRPRRRRRRSCCSPPARSRRPTCASSSVGCARSSGSSARRSTCRQRPRKKGERKGRKRPGRRRNGRFGPCELRKHGRILEGACPSRA